MLRYIRFHGREHPKTLSASHLEAFLSDLAVRQNRSPATQKTALNALAFLYREFLDRPLELEGLNFTRSRRPQRVSVVFIHEEALALISKLDGVNQMVAHLIYGAALLINVTLRLRVECLNFAMQQI